MSLLWLLIFEMSFRHQTLDARLAVACANLVLNGVGRLEMQIWELLTNRWHVKPGVWVQLQMRQHRWRS